MQRIIFLILVFLSPTMAQAEESQQKLAPINHIIVFYLENHSFDNVLGTFPDADGIANAGKNATQIDAQGKPYVMLPRVMNDKEPDPRFPDALPNAPFLMTKYAPISEKIGDPVHRFYQTQAQMDGGKMDKFAQISNTGGLVMGYYEEKDAPLWQYAQKYTLADHFFTGAFGGSMLNHFWLVCACTPNYPHAPEKLHAQLDAKGNLMRDGALSPEGDVINTIQPRGFPYDPKVNDPAMRLPASNLPTIGDRLSEKHIDWAWYAGDWNQALSQTNPPPFFPYHHQPFIYFANYAEGTSGRAQHLKDETDLIAGIEKGLLPPVVFYKPSGTFDWHPGYTKLDESERHVFDLVSKIEKSLLWKDSVIIITFDDAGGFWDHVAPPKGDRFGPGERVPTLIISPFAKRGFIDHTTYDTTSILKLIETKYDIKPLSDRDAKANDLRNALQP